jgi:Caulimovirus viroplasmin
MSDYRNPKSPLDGLEEPDSESFTTERSTLDSAGDEHGYKLLTVENCQALFTLPTRGITEYVCGSGGKCRRAGHAAARAVERGHLGYYEMVVHRSYADGLAETHLTEEEYGEYMVVAQDGHRAELADMGAALDIFSGEKTADNVARMVTATPVIMRHLNTSPGEAEETLKPAAQPLKETETSTVVNPVNRGPSTIRRTVWGTARLSSTAKPPPRASSTNTNIAMGWYYAVAIGRDSKRGVYRSWAEAAPLVNGVAGAVFKKFRLEEDAVDFVLNYTAPAPPPDLVPVVIDHQTRTTPRMTGSMGITRTIEVQGEGPEQYSTPRRIHHGEPGLQQALSQLGGQLETLPVPTPGMMGPDPSAKKDDVVFGIDLGSEEDLRNQLAPPGLNESDEKRLAKKMLDVVSLPGTLTGGSSSETSDFSLMGMALEELANSAGSEGRGDVSWRQRSRTSIRQVTDLVSLQKRLNQLVKLRDKVLNKDFLSTKSVLTRAGWPVAHATLWAHHGLHARIVRDSLENYIGLHYHLTNQAINARSRGRDGWSYVKDDVTHHTEALESIRAMHDSRLQALCAIYAYLRDGSKASWFNSSLQVERNLDLYVAPVSMRTTVGSTGAGEMACTVCPKCKTSLHGGGKSGCPWRRNTTKKAMEEAQKFMRAQAAGQVAVPDGGSDVEVDE